MSARNVRCHPWRESVRGGMRTRGRVFRSVLEGDASARLFHGAARRACAWCIGRYVPATRAIRYRWLIESFRLFQSIWRNLKHSQTCKYFACSAGQDNQLLLIVVRFMTYRTRCEIFACWGHVKYEEVRVEGIFVLYEQYRFVETVVVRF